jgi:hypothetical protein
MRERKQSVASLLLVLSALVCPALLVGPESIAPVPIAAYPWDDDDDRREWEQRQRTMIPSLERGWTWGIMPPGQYRQDNGDSNLATGCTRKRGRASSQQSKNTWTVTDEWDGYVPRISAGRGAGSSGPIASTAGEAQYPRWGYRDRNG